MIWFFVLTLIFFLVLCCGAVVEFLIKRKQEKQWFDEECKLHKLDREAINREIGLPFFEVESSWTSAADKRRSNKSKGWVGPVKGDK